MEVITNAIMRGSDGLKKNRNDDEKREEELAKWIEIQKEDYKNRSGMMKNDEIYNLWTEFINDPKYKKYFMDN